MVYLVIEFTFNVSELKYSMSNFCEVDSNVFLFVYFLIIKSHSHSAMRGIIEVGIK